MFAVNFEEFQNLLSPSFECIILRVESQQFKRLISGILVTHWPWEHNCHTVQIPFFWCNQCRNMIRRLHVKLGTQTGKLMRPVNQLSNNNTKLYRGHFCLTRDGSCLSGEKYLRPICYTPFRTISLKMNAHPMASAVLICWSAYQSSLSPDCRPQVSVQLQEIKKCQCWNTKKKIFIYTCLLMHVICNL